MQLRRWTLGKWRPEHIGEILKHPKVMAAMMNMVKFDIAALKAAARE
jgi:predicted 3-demethylubiquinone-9 3-methyltransferase (glyoxalase superfamily)